MRVESLATLDQDGALLFTTRIVRMFGYGFLSVVLVLYLVALGFDDVRIGLLLTLTLLGDAAISLFLTTRSQTKSTSNRLGMLMKLISV